MPVDGELSDAHRSMLTQDSGIDAAVIAARGYETVTVATRLKRLGFGSAQTNVPALLLPVWSTRGAVELYQSRPDRPRVKDGKSIKYETVFGGRMVMDVHPSARHLLRDPRVPLFVTEGVKKGDALLSRGCCAVALLGVWNWRGKNDAGGKTALADWDDVALNERRVYIVFDSDVMLKREVYGALIRLDGFLKSRGASVMFIYLPPGPNGEKLGVDDYVAAGHTVDGLLRLATPDLLPPPHSEERDLVYRAADVGLIWRKPTNNGAVDTALTNFTATIVGDVIEDDGAETRRQFEIDGCLSGRRRRFRVPAAQFGTLNWVTERLGAGAIVYPGFGLRDHARAAIQLLSGDVPERYVYAHTGWRKIDGQWLFLHGDGAVGADGQNDHVNVELSGGLADFRLPPPASGHDLRSAVRASLRLFDLAPMSVTAPLLGATFLAPLREALRGCGYDLVVWFHGRTGEFKTEAVVLAQAHYGPFTRTKLPLTFTATANAVERTLFSAKDVLVVVDDFHPSSDRREEQAMASTASRLLRGVGNGSGRPRMRADTSLRPDLRPRGLVIATGERLPGGQSTVARMFPVAIDPGAINVAKLTAAQGDAHLLPRTTSAYISWLAGRLDDLCGKLPARFAELRALASTEDMHAREPGQIAHLMLGAETFLQFAVEVGALQADEARSLNARVWDALIHSSVQHRIDLGSEAPARRFVSLLVDALASRRVYLEGPRGGEPGDPQSWGWERYDWTDGTGQDRTGFRHVPSAPLLGQVDDEFLYLHPETTFQCITQAANQAGQTFPVDRLTLQKRLDEEGMIVCEVENGRRHRTVNHRFGNRTQRVIKLHRRSLSSVRVEQGEHGEQQGSLEAVEAQERSPSTVGGGVVGNAGTSSAASDAAFDSGVPLVPPADGDGREVYVV